MRKPHFLRGNKATRLPSRLVFFDTETLSVPLSDTESEARLDFGWACYVRRYQSDKWSDPVWLRFTRPGELWTFIASKVPDSTRLFAYAHNLSFDHVVCKGFSALPKRGWKLKKSIIESPPVSLKYVSGTRTIQLLDTLNYFRIPLKELGKSIGLDKYDMPPEDASQEDKDTYCKRDVEIILRAMLNYLDLVKSWDLGNYAITQASQSFNVYKHRFMHHPIFIDCNERALDISRKAYYGGRTECFKVGEIAESLYLYDINSQYPYVMREHEYPTMIVTVINRVEEAELRGLLEQYCLCAHVRVKTREAVYPFNTGERLIFPIGEFETYLSTPELAYALQHGHIQEVMSCAVYEKAPIFRDYVDYFYSKRQEYKDSGNDTMSYFCKIFMNSLYGKFGQTGQKYQWVAYANSDGIELWEEIDHETKARRKMRQYAGLIEEKAESIESRESHPAIAAHVTAYARMLLWQYKKQAGHKNCYYVDTDSLLVNAKGQGRLAPMIDSKRLGALKLELETANATLYSPKDYVIGERVKHKGVKPRAQDLGNATFRQDQFSTLAGLLRRGNLDVFVIKQVVKRLTREYRKGIVESNGAVTPFLLKANQGALPWQKTGSPKPKPPRKPSGNGRRSKNCS